MAFGGGGGAGRMDFPEYMKTQHESWVGEVDDYIQTLRLGPSPYASAFAYDPTDDITALEDAYDAFEEVVEGLNPSTDWQSNFDDAKTKVDTLYGTTAVNDAVTAFEAAGQADLMKGISRFTAGMQSHNAIIGNMAFPIGLAIMNSEFEKSVDSYRENLSLQNERSQADAVLSATAQLEAEKDRQIKAHQTAVAIRDGVSKTSIQANSDWFRLELGIDVEDDKYDLTLYDHGHSMIGALAGSATVPKPTPFFERVIGGFVGTGMNLLQIASVIS